MPNSLHRQLDYLRQRALQQMQANPGKTAGALLLAGALAGAGLGQLLQNNALAREKALVQETRQELQQTQRDINAMSARLAQLQAEANRLNALGERLARQGELEAGEFDFAKPVPQGGVGPTRAMQAHELKQGIDALEVQLGLSGQQLSVIDALIFSRELDRSLLPSRAPVAQSYITSGFGYRADPFGAGAQFHRGIDFDANYGDAVLAVADGVVSFAGDQSGYGLTVEIDHGNGYVSRLAHNSRLSVTVGDLVRTGQEIARAGSTGRSTGVHVHLELWKDGYPVNPRPFLDY